MSNANFNFGHIKNNAGQALGGIDDFAGHRTRDSRGDTVIKGKEWRDAGKIDLWLMRDAPIAIAVWRHRFYRVIEKRAEEGKRGERIVVPANFNCHEREEVLKKQFRRRQDGSRLVPPERCPFDKLAELVREMCVDGKLSWVEPVLKFEGDDRTKAVILHAGDFWNAFGSNDLSQEEIAEVRRAAAPSKRDAWKSALLAKCSYIYTVVEDAHPELGGRIAVEGEGLTSAMQRAIAKRAEEVGSSAAADPRKNPILIRWKYDDRAKNPRDTYDVVLVSRPPSEEIAAAIAGEPPDLSDELALGDVDELRALFEAHQLVKLPLDKAFPARDPAAAQPRGQGTQDKDPPPAEELADCDFCRAEKVMTADETTCPKCGAIYGEFGEPDDSGLRALGVVAMPCLACKAPVPLPGWGGNPGKIGDEVACPNESCKAPHREVVEGDASRWERVALKGEVEGEPAKPVRAPRRAGRA